MSTILYIFTLTKYQPKYRLKHSGRTKAINSHKNTYLHLINRHAPAPIISEACINTSATVGKTRHKSTPAPKASAEAPTVFAKLQRIKITAFHF